MREAHETVEPLVDDWTDLYAVSELEELFDVSRSTVYRAVRRAARTPTTAAATTTTTTTAAGQVDSHPN